MKLSDLSQFSIEGKIHGKKSKKLFWAINFDLSSLGKPL